VSHVTVSGGWGWMEEKVSHVLVSGVLEGGRKRYHMLRFDIQMNQDVVLNMARLVAWSVCCLVGRFVGWSVGWLVGCSVGLIVPWVVGWLVGWIVPWLVGWFQLGWLVGSFQSGCWVGWLVGWIICVLHQKNSMS
jgi:hypothetical protein